MGSDAIDKGLDETQKRKSERWEGYSTASCREVGGEQASLQPWVTPRAYRARSPHYLARTGLNQPISKRDGEQDWIVGLESTVQGYTVLVGAVRQ